MKGLSPKAIPGHLRSLRPRRYRRFSDKFGRQSVPFGSGEAHKPRPTTGIYDRRVHLAVMAGLLGGLVLMLAIFFIGRIPKVKEVTAVDGTLYTAAHLISQAGIEPGDEMVSFDARGVRRRLRERLPLLDTVKVHRHWNGTVSIEVTEITALSYTCHNRNYYILNAETGEVLCVMATPDEARRVGAMYIGYPEAARVRVGETLSFVHLPYAPDSAPSETTAYEVETGEPEEEYAYVAEFIERLAASPLGERVVGMELADRYDLWFVLDGRIRVRVGSMDELERKLTMVARSLEDVAAGGQAPTDQPMLVDVSDPARIIHRTAPDILLPDWAILPG